jgi:hypothetical protein
MNRVFVPTVVHPAVAARLDFGAIDLYLTDRYLAHLAAGVPVAFAYAAAKADLANALGSATSS